MFIIQRIDSISLIYYIWWSILILLTITTLILSIFCLNQCPNEPILPYILLGHSCLTLFILLLLCYLRHGNDNRCINYLSVFILFIYFLSFICTTIFTFRRMKYVDIQSTNSPMYCLSYCYPIAIGFFLTQIIGIICQLPLVCFILIFSVQNSLHTCDTI
jgi:hypothetical protein